MKKRLYFCLAIVLCSVVYAEPSVTTVSGTVQHEQTITITGSGFGVKNPAAPVMWDDCTDNPPLSTYYDAWLPTNAEQGSQYNMAYRDADFRGIGSPNGRMSYFLGGAHAISDHSGTYSAGGNVALGKNIRSHEYFISYYYRIDPNFDEEDSSAGGDNMKEITLTDTEGEFYIDRQYSFGYVGICGSHVPDINFKDPFRIGRIPIEPENWDAPYACSQDEYVVTHNNPINGWIKMQWEGIYNFEYDSPTLSLTTYPDGHQTNKSHFGGPITISEYFRGFWAGYPKLDNLRFIGIGGFARVERENNGVNSFRYFAGVYIDSTHARVMLGDSPGYESCTIMEPQPPTAWSGESITATTNLGALPDSGTAYLFVFDADNNHNDVGYPISISASAGPYCGDGICNGDENCSTCETDCGNCTVECIHDADNNPCDGEISVQELSAYINEWKAGQVTIQDLMGAIMIWKG